MMQINIKRCLSLILAMVLTFSLLPVSALAEEAAETIAIETTSLTEATEAPTEAPVETTIPVTEETVPETTAPAVVVEETAPVVAAANSNKDTVQAGMDAIAAKYLDLTKVMTAEDAAQAVADMDDDTWFEALIEVEDLESSDAVHALTEEELVELAENNPLFCAFADAVYERAAMLDDAGLYTTVNVLDGKVSVTDSANSNSVSNGTVTITAKGSLFSKKTNNVTITNETENSATLQFDYSASDYNSFTIAGIASSSSGSYSIELDGGSSLSMSLQSKSGWNAGTATLTLSNFSLSDSNAAYNVTVKFDNSLGSVTDGDGESLTSEDTIEGVTTSAGVALTAAAKNSSVFLGWVDKATAKRLSTALNYTVKPTENCTVMAAFASASSDAWFLVVHNGVDYLFNDLAEAATFASASTGKTVILAANGTLSARLDEDKETVISYEIPSGVTLLIPYNTDHTVQRSEPTGTDASFKSPTPFRTLTMADGAAITVDGEMSVSGLHSAVMGYNGRPHGPQGYVIMNEGSSITVNGTLYAWGYIVSEKRTSNTALPKTGTVTINSSGTIYECFQVVDYRGGDATSGMTSGDNISTYKVFPMSQYYVQNVQVPMKLMNNATEVGFMSVTVSYLGVKHSAVPFVGGNSLFRINSGYIIKDYDEVNDRMIIDVNGDLAMSSMSMTIQTGIFPVTIKSENYVLPITSHLTVNLNGKSTATLSQNMALLPGAQINIGDEAKLSIASGSNLYVYDAEQWGGYVTTSEKKMVALPFAYDRVAARGEASLVDAAIKINGVVDASKGYIYTTESGANIYSTDAGQMITKAGTETVTYQVTNQEAVNGSQQVTYGAINIVPAIMQNENGDDVSTASATETTTYNYDHHNCTHGDSATHGVWYAGEHDIVETVIAPTTTSKGYTSHTCACGHAYTDNEVPALVDGVIYGTNIRIGDTLDLHFYINRSVLDPLIQEGKTYNAVLTREYVNSEGNPDTSDKTYQQAEWEVYNSKYYRVSYDGFAAKEMTDDVHITIYEADTGYQVSETKTDSIRGYAVRSLKNTNNPEALRRTVIDMLNYGASAQEHFDYKTDDLANTGDSVIANNAEFATGEVTYVPDDISDNSADFYGLNISLKSDLYLNFYFKNVPTGSTATFTYVKHNGSKITDTIPYESFISTTADGVALTGIRVQGLGIADGRTKVTCTLSNGEKAIASIEGYVAETISPDKNPEKTLIAVCENLMKFIDSANAYFK